MRTITNKGFERNTQPRRVILEELKKVKTHPTADQVYRMVKRRLPRISLGTVYRNLNRLRNQGRVLELNLNEPHHRYDGNPINHYHFFCQRCRRVFDLETRPGFKELNRKIVIPSGFKVLEHRLEFYGICQECR